MSDKARDFIGQGHPHGEQQGKGTQNSSAVAHSSRLSDVIRVCLATS